MSEETQAILEAIKIATILIRTALAATVIGQGFYDPFDFRPPPARSRNE